MDKDNTELLTAAEVSRRLRLKRSTVYQAAADGRIPCVKLWRGKKKTLLRFRATDIEAMVTARSVPAK